MFFEEFPLPKEPLIPDYSVDIRDFGAVENELSTAINQAIEHVFRRGGGKVVVPSGKWLTGPIRMQSNTELHFEAGAKVLFSNDPRDYLPAVLTMYEGIRCYNYSPLIYGNGLENVAITGNGELDGNGAEWWKWAKNLKARDVLYSNTLPLEKRVFATEDYGLRPMFLQILATKNLLIDGITLKNSPCWTLNLVWCEDSIVRNVTVENPTVSPNTDGINVESSNRVIVEDCTVVTTGDDMFCLKAGRNEDAWEVGIPCQNVIIRRCKSIGRCRSGGIAIGSEMSAGIRNVLVEDCDFGFCVNCVRIKSKDGRGGVVENIDMRNLHMAKGMRGINVSFRYSCEANDAPKEPGKYMPKVRNISFENVVCDSVTSGISFDNLPGGIMENLHFKNINMTARKCLESDSVQGLCFENITLTECKDAGGNLYEE